MHLIFNKTVITRMQSQIQLNHSQTLVKDFK